MRLEEVAFWMDLTWYLHYSGDGNADASRSRSMLSLPMNSFVAIRSPMTYTVCAAQKAGGSLTTDHLPVHFSLAMAAIFLAVSSIATSIFCFCAQTLA